MCGIAGLIQKRKVPVEDVNRFIETSKLMNHRGPDYMGVEKYNNVTLIHFRLSIIDLDARSHQPFTTQSGRYTCVYNGEIYNFQNIRKDLGVNCKTTSDTEVMLEHFEAKCTAAIPQWNGIFATAILDKEKNSLYLIRDRLGIKPLYIYENEDVILFASEAKVILNYLDEFSLNYESVHKFIWFGNTTGENTVVNNLLKIKPATFSEIDLTSFETKTTSYWDYTSITTKSYSEPDAINELQSKLKMAVERQLIADVPVGILLSGGVDSSGLVAIASEVSGNKIDTYSIDYDYNIGGISELKKAEILAIRYGTNHNELRVTTKEVQKIFAKLVFQFDEPFADPASIPLYQLANACSSDKRVILQGDGGDELFAGYDRYKVVNHLKFWKTLFHLHFLIPDNRLRERMKRLCFVLGHEKAAELISYYLTVETPYKNPLRLFSDGFRDQLSPTDWMSDYKKVVGKLNGKTTLDKLLLADFDILLTHRYLEKVDKATMLCSVESRVPYLDNEMVDFALSLPSNFKIRGNQTKYILKKSLENYVPKEILYGKKRGFDVPYKEWLRTDLYDYAKHLFYSMGSEFLNLAEVNEILELHKSRKADYGDLLWKVLVFCSWIDNYKHKLTNY